MKKNKKEKQTKEEKKAKQELIYQNRTVEDWKAALKKTKRIGYIIIAVLLIVILILAICLGNANSYGGYYDPSYDTSDITLDDDTSTATATKTIDQVEDNVYNALYKSFEDTDIDFDVKHDDNQLFIEVVQADMASAYVSAVGGDTSYWETYKEQAKNISKTTYDELQDAGLKDYSCDVIFRASKNSQTLLSARDGEIVTDAVTD